MRGTVAVAKEADKEKEFSPTNTIIHHVRDEHEMQLGSLGGVIGNIRHDGGKPSAESIAMQMSGMPTGERAPALLALQRTRGNRYVQRVVAGIQAKLVVGQPGDKYEQEADAVLRMPKPQVRRQLEDEEEDEEIIQPKEAPGQTPEVASDLESRINSLKGGGQPLPKSVRAYFEPRFGHDFSQVRIHNDSQAAETAQTLNARAFTFGRDIVFGVGQYMSETAAGKRLLAHELTHVLQQRFGEAGHNMRQAIISDHGGADEVEAETIAARLNEGPRFKLAGLHSHGLKIQRVIPMGVTNDATSREADRQIEEARELLNYPNLDPTIRRELESSIREADATLATYRRTIDSNSIAMNPVLASATTSSREAAAAAGVVALILALAQWIFTTSASRTATNRDAADDLGTVLQRLGDFVDTVFAVFAVSVSAIDVDEMIRTLESEGVREQVRRLSQGPGNFEFCFRIFARCLVIEGFEQRWIGMEGLAMPEMMALIWEVCMGRFIICMSSGFRVISE